MVETTREELEDLKRSLRMLSEASAKELGLTESDYTFIPDSDQVTLNESVLTELVDNNETALLNLMEGGYEGLDALKELRTPAKAEIGTGQESELDNAQEHKGIFTRIREMFSRLVNAIKHLFGMGAQPTKPAHQSAPWANRNELGEEIEIIKDAAKGNVSAVSQATAQPQPGDGNDSGKSKPMSPDGSE